MAHFKVVVLAAMVASSLAIPAYDRSSYGHSTSGGVIYAQRLANTRGPTLGYSRASNPGYSHAASTNLGYTHGSARYGYDAADNYAPPNYEFSYDVNDPQTNDMKQQTERRVGDKVDGHYSVLEPDGTTRTVRYSADDRNGFNAVVTRSGNASHPVTPTQIHGAMGYYHAGPISSHSRHSKYPDSYPERVTQEQDALSFSPYYAATPRDAYRAHAMSFKGDLGHGYGGSFMGHDYSMTSTERGYGGHY